MMKRYESMMRKAMPFFAAGVLLQTGGCDTNELLAGWLNSVLTTMIQNLVFGSFNLI